MSYKIYTDKANAVISEILRRVKAGKDEKGKDIRTWEVVKNDKDEERLIHTTEQWEEKGCIRLTSDDDNKIIYVRFFYWSSFKEDERSGDEDKYYLGRFTELMLVHFEGLYKKIEIV